MPAVIEVDSAIDVGQQQIDAQHRNADRGIRACKHLRSGRKLLFTAAAVGPSLDLILGKDEVGSKTGKLQIISMAVEQDRQSPLQCAFARAGWLEAGA